MNFNEKIRSFFANRNGMDHLGIFTFLLYGLLMFINVFVKENIIDIIIFILIFISLFRILSKNRIQRQKENAVFLTALNKLKNLFKSNKPKKIKIKKIKKVKVRNNKSIRKNGKVYLLKPCPICQNTLEVRKIKGERYVYCSKCKNEVLIKI